MLHVFAAHTGLMDRILYAGESLVTGTEIAAALLDYAQALASTGGSDTVEIQVVQADGSAVRASFVIGPASQLVALAESDDRPELEDAGVVDDLRRRAAALATPIAVPGERSLFAPDDLEF